MSRIKILTAGESHGKKITGIIEGLPSGLPLKKDKINFQLQRRQKGFGRGGRMKIEKDQVEIVSGVRFGNTLGSPITIQITNRDWDNWKKVMAVWDKNEIKPVTVPRPGHADLAGSIKYNTSDIRDILERASARETAARVAIGAIIRQLLNLFGITVISQVTSIHDISVVKTFKNLSEQPSQKIIKKLRELAQKAKNSSLNCYDAKTEKRISNGEPIIVTAVMKPIPTLIQPLPSVDIITGETVNAHKERTDTCSVPSASIVGEAMLSISLGKAFCEKYGGDSILEMRKHFNGNTSF